MQSRSHNYRRNCIGGKSTGQDVQAFISQPCQQLDVQAFISSNQQRREEREGREDRMQEEKGDEEGKGEGKDVM